MNSDWEVWSENTPVVRENAKAVLEGQVHDLWEANKNVARLEEALAAAKAKVRHIAEEIIPNTLEDMGLEEVTVKGGLKVRIKQSVHATPRVENREGVYNWLEAHGHGGLIKRQGVFTVGRDNEAKAKRWIKSIKSFPGRYERKVEPSTLRSFVKQCLQEGTEIPMDLFGAYTRRVAEIKSDYTETMESHHATRKGA